MHFEDELASSKGEDSIAGQLVGAIQCSDCRGSLAMQNLHSQHGLDSDIQRPVSASKHFCGVPGYGEALLSETGSVRTGLGGIQARGLHGLSSD